MLYFNTKKLVVAVISASVFANSPWVDALPAACTDTRRLESNEDMGECASELYDLSLYVDANSRHAMMIAQPTENEDCPWILWEAATNESEEEVEAHVDAVYMEKMGHIIHPIQDLDGLELGNFTLTSLQDAFEDTVIDTTNPYHVVTNNCGSLPVRMMANLGIDATDQEVVSYTAEKLSSGADFNHYPVVMRMIMDAMHAYGAWEEYAAATIKAQLL